MLPLYLCTKGSSRTLSQRGPCISTAKNFTPQNTEDYHSPLPNEGPGPGGAQVVSTSLFSASHQHPEDLQTQAFTLLSAGIQCPQLTLFLRSHQPVWWRRQGGGFHQPSSHRRAPPEAQTPEESAAVRPEGHCLLLEKMIPSFGARKERKLFWKPSAPVPEFLPEYVSRLTSFCQISV